MKRLLLSRTRIMALLTTLLFVSCSSLPVKTEPPRVSLVGLSVVTIELFEQRYEVQLRAVNATGASGFSVPLAFSTTAATGPTDRFPFSLRPPLHHRMMTTQQAAAAAAAETIGSRFHCSM